jgi:hypothetical protein
VANSSGINKKGRSKFMAIWRPMKKILLAIPEDLLVEIDEGAKANIMCRTEYIRQILKEEVGDRYPDKIRKINLKDPARFADLDDS